MNTHSESEEYVVDRSGWPSGLWDREPDKRVWVDAETGLDCMFVRNNLGTLCGYVGVGEKHPLFSKGYADAAVSVHGGLTYAAACDGAICHPSPHKTWWFGFDCAHHGDIGPGLTKFSRAFAGGHYRTQAYVEDEVRSLARQLKALA